MKNTAKMRNASIFGIALLLAAIIFSFAACDNGDVPVVLKSIVITGQPTAVHYVGNELDTTGLEVTAIYSDGTTAPVTGYTISGFSSATPGNKTVTVNYNGKNAAFTVTVFSPAPAAELQSIVVTGQPTAIHYVGDELDTTGLVLTAIYNDGSTLPVTTGFTTGAFSSAAPGNKTVTVSYNDKNAAFTVNVISSPPTIWATGTQATFTGSAATGSFPQDVVWGGGKFIMVGRTGTMAYSSDALSWTDVPSGAGPGNSQFPASNHFQGICWGNDLFIASGSGGNMVSSPDGTTWSTVTQSVTASYVNYTAWGEDKFIFVTSDSTGRIGSSPDGATNNWTQVTGLPGSPDFRTIVYDGPSGAKKFIGVGGNGYIAYSADGVTSWTSASKTPTTPGSSFRWRKIAYGNGKYVVVGRNGNIAYSTDLSDWSEVTQGSTPFGSSEIMDIVWARGTFVAVGGKVIASSYDGVNWTDIPHSLGLDSDGSFTCITYGDNKFVIGARKDNSSTVCPGIIGFSD